MIVRPSRQFLASTGAIVLALTGATAAEAQIRFGTPGESIPGESRALCRGTNGELFASPLGDCDGYLAYQSNAILVVGPNATAIRLDGSNGNAQFSGVTEFFGQTNLNGPTSFNGPVSLTGSVTAAGITSTNGFANTGGFSNAGTFTSTGTGNITGRLTTGALTTDNFDAINGSVVNFDATILRAGSLSVAGSLTLGTNAIVNAGGNRIQNVGAPIAGTDAANRNYVDNAVAVANAGVAQATADNARQDQELTDVRATNTRQDQELTDVRAVNATQATQIAAVQTVNARQDQELTDVRTINATQSTQIAGVQVVNTRQDTELVDLRALNAAQSGQITAIQALDTVQSQQIGSLQAGQAALFDLATTTRRELGETNEGVAMALAMESPALPPGTSFALSGGIGYFANKASLTSAITARVARNSSVSAGVGVGLNSGKVGARGGFQIAW